MSKPKSRARNDMEQLRLSSDEKLGAAYDQGKGAIIALRTNRLLARWQHARSGYKIKLPGTVVIAANRHQVEEVIPGRKRNYPLDVG